MHFNNGVSDPEYYMFTVKDPAPQGIGYWTWISAMGLATVTSVARAVFRDAAT